MQQLPELSNVLFVGNPIYEGLTKKQVASAAQVCRVLVTGFTNRTVSATTYNAESSRSHAVFELQVQQKYVDELSGETMNRGAKINVREKK